MHLFYTPDITSELYTLHEDESKHCIKVLRLQTGDTVTLIDGKGGLYTAEIVDPHPKKTILKVVNTQLAYGKRNHYLHLAVAPTKNIERIEWLLEKATEIGVDEISLVICDRSERKEVKLDRLNRIITSAIKQSLKAYHPVLNEPIAFKNFIKQTRISQRFIAHCMPEDKKTLQSCINNQGDYVILIGPEGDFTPHEITAAIENKFIPITLGNSRLRTETAALEACFEVNFLNR